MGSKVRSASRSFISRSILRFFAFPLSFTLQACNLQTFQRFAALFILLCFVYIETDPRRLDVDPTAYSPTSCSPYTLPSSVSRKSCICHSYENTEGVGVFFPFWLALSSDDGFNQSSMRKGD